MEPVIELWEAGNRFDRCGCCGSEVARLRELRLGSRDGDHGHATVKVMCLVCIQRLKELVSTCQTPQRGIDYACEGCRVFAGSDLDDGHYRCRFCGYPGQ